jgi:hypothetical protein
MIHHVPQQQWNDYNFMILEFKFKFEDSLFDDGDDNGVGGWNWTLCLTNH